MKKRALLGVTSLLGLMAVSCSTVPKSGAEAKLIYQNDFEDVAVGPLPDLPTFMVLDGNFEIKEETANRFMELPGAPLETYGVLFGPAFDPESGKSRSLGARIRGEATGRRLPAFGIGLSGIGGYRLQLTASKRAVELYRGDEVVARQRYLWKSGTWLNFHLTLDKTAEGWAVKGLVWPEGEVRPELPLIEFVDDGESISGKASVWGIPYSGKPIQFDALELR